MITDQSNPLIRMMTYVFSTLLHARTATLNIVALTKDLSLLEMKNQLRREFDNDNS